MRWAATIIEALIMLVVYTATTTLLGAEFDPEAWVLCVALLALRRTKDGAA